MQFGADSLGAEILRKTRDVVEEMGRERWEACDITLATELKILFITFASICIMPKHVY